MSSKIFISYRRDNGASHAGRIHDRLASEFGSHRLFMDVDAIPLGANFVRVLRDEVAKCDVLLAVIDSRWLDSRDDKGDRRLDNPDDFVRVEIATALQRGIPVIPILIEGTRVPKVSQLPFDLQELVRHNGLDLGHASFHRDMERLIRELKGGLVIGDQIEASTLKPGRPDRNRFVSIDLGDIANYDLDWLSHPPSGDITLDGIPFVIRSGIRAIAHTRNLDRTDLPTSLRLDVGGVLAKSLHLLINGNWVQPAREVGSVRILYKNGTSRDVSLIGMQTIRETWMYKDDVFNQSLSEPPDGVTLNLAYQEPQKRANKEAIGFFDRLSVVIDPAQPIQELLVSNANWKSKTGIILTAVTIEQAVG